MKDKNMDMKQLNIEQCNHNFEVRLFCSKKHVHSIECTIEVCSLCGEESEDLSD